MTGTLGDPLESDVPRSERSTSADVLTGGLRILRRWPIVIGAAAVAAALAFGVVALRPPQFTATSTVVVVPPAMTTSFSSPVLPSAGFQQLATSTHVVDRVAEALRTEGVIEAGESAGTFVARLRESGASGTPYLSLIMLEVTAGDPERARVAANRWAELLVAEERSIASRGSTFVLSEFPKAAEAYERAERESQTLADTQARELADVKTRAAESLLRARLRSREQAVVWIEESLDAARLEQVKYDAQIQQLTKELAGLPEVITLSRSLADDALLRAARNGAEVAPPSVGTAPARVTADEINPTHAMFAQQLAQARVNQHAAAAQIAMLETQRKARLEEASAARESLVAAEMRLAMTTRRHELELAEQARRLDQLKTRFTFLSEKVGEADVAAASNEGALRVGGVATSAVPSGPSPRMAAAVAFVGAGLAMLVVLWLAEYLDALRRAR
jgi:hypothetical protein